MMVEIAPGKYVVCESRFGGSFEVMRVVQVKGSTFIYYDKFFKRDRRKGKSCVVYCGSQQQAELCAQQMRSGRAQYEADCRAAAVRWVQRKANILKADSLTAR